MSQLKIMGGKPLAGQWPLSGNKNEALPLVAASLLIPKLVLTDVPDLTDVRVMIEIAEHLGVEVIRGKTLELTAPKKIIAKLPLDLCRKIRGSLLFLGPLLVRGGRAEIPRVGGDKIGARKIDTHLEVFRAFGATVNENNLRLNLKKFQSGGKKLIWLSEPSVTATENALLMSSVRPGITNIKNAASEPHVTALAQALVAAGVQIEGIGSNVLTVDGSARLRPVEHHIGKDFIELGSILVLSALSGGKISLPIADSSMFEKIFAVFEQMGVEVLRQNGSVSARLRSGNRQSSELLTVGDGPWPSFPSDLMSPLIILATQLSQPVLFHEKMFESRLYFTDQLRELGAKLVLCDPHRLVTMGPTKLRGAHLTSPDIRAGIALVIAALIADGESMIDNALQLDRGYERLVEKLTAVGAAVSRQ